MLVQDALVLFADDLAGDDDFGASTLCSLYKSVRILCFVSQKCLGLQPTQQFGNGFEVVTLACDQHKAQRVAQHVARGVYFSITSAARYADGLRAVHFPCLCRGLVCPPAG